MNQALLAKSISRRRMIGALAAAPMAGALARALDISKPGTALGIGMYSYGFHWRAGRRQPESSAGFRGALDFVEHAHALGAGGVQVSLSASDRAQARKIRSRIEEFGMYFEGEASLPESEADIARFESELAGAKEAGASIIRAAMLNGRRYETFHSAADFEQFARQRWRALHWAEPIVRKQQLRLAVENHKDWRAAELASMLRQLGSERVGVCLDTGNNIALLEDPMQTAQVLAPFVFSTHFKDMAARECPEGFLLSEIPLGAGMLNLPAIIRLVRQAAPGVHWNLEMITRDPLKIPCLTPGYWATLEHVPGRDLAATLAMVRSHPAPRLPHVSGLSLEQALAFEEENVRASLDFARRTLQL